MTTKTEGQHAGEFIVSEAPGTLSRDTVTVLSGQNLSAGAVLGKLTRALAAAPIPAIVGTGTGAMTLLTFGPAVQTGNYVITLLATSATAAFSVVAPDGTALPNGAVGTAYTTSHISFLISTGGTMTLGDAYTVAVTAGGTPVLVGTGTGVVSAFTLGAEAQNGTYRVQLLATSATAEFEVIAPDGSKLKRGQVATAYTSNHVNFTLANGGTMTSGDYFNLVVAAGSGKVVAWAPTAVDGTEDPYGILFDNYDATLADVAGVAIVRDAEVNSAELKWGAAVTAAQKAVALAKLKADNGVVAR